MFGLPVRFHWISKNFLRQIRVLCKCLCGEWFIGLYVYRAIIDKFSIYWGKEEIPATLYSLWGVTGLMLRNVGLMKFCNPSWLDIWTFWLRVTFCAMPIGLQHTCKVNSSMQIAEWIFNWEKGTQHSSRAPLGVIAMISKRSYWHISNIIINFLYLDLLVVRVLLN